MKIRREDLSWNGETGATLVELMIYLALAATILVTVNNGVQLFERSASRSVAATERSAKIDLALTRLSGAIADIARVAVQQSNKAAFAFAGSGSQISFPVETGTGIAMASLAAVKTKTGNTLLVFSGGGHREVWLDGPYAIRFSYRSARGADTGWLARWPQQNRMPDLIRVDLREAPNGPAAAPPLVAALMRDAETACNDPKAPGCTISTEGELR